MNVNKERSKGFKDITMIMGLESMMSQFNFLICKPIHDIHHGSLPVWVSSDSASAAVHLIIAMSYIPKHWRSMATIMEAIAPTFPSRTRRIPISLTFFEHSSLFMGFLATKAAPTINIKTLHWQRLALDIPDQFTLSLLDIQTQEGCLVTQEVGRFVR